MADTTVTVPTTKEWTAWSEYESEYNRATKTSGVVGPVVGSFVVIVFVISIFCFTTHVRRRRQQLLARAARRAQDSNQGGRPFVIGHSHSPDWVDRSEADGNDVSRIIQDLPPPYTPPYETELKDGDLPPCYAEAVAMHSYDNPGAGDVTRPEVNSADYDTDYGTDYSVDDDVNNDVTRPEVYYDDYETDYRTDYSVDDNVNDDVTRPEVNSADYDTDNRTDYSDDGDVNDDVTYNENVPYGANEEENVDPYNHYTGS